MAKRSAVPAPAAAIDDDLPWDKPKSDDETANLFEPGDEQGAGTGDPVDAENDDELETKLRASLDQLHDDDDEHDDQPIKTPLSDQLKQPVGQVLSTIALQGVSSHAKKRPISALANEWLVTTYDRLTGLLSVQPDADEAADWKRDVQLLECEADLRNVDLFAAMPVTSNEELGRIARGEDKIVDGPTRITDEQEAARHRHPTPGVIFMAPIEEIDRDPGQARDEGADDELAELIKANGFYQSKPIELRIHPQARDIVTYMIVDGERRFRGALKAGLTHVPAMIVDAGDEGERLLRQVNSNQGKPLKPMEEARTWKRIMAAKGWNIQQLADHLGKSKSTVSDRLALADVPAAFLPLFEKGELTAAAAPILRPLQGLPEKVIKSMIAFAQEGPDWERAVNDGKPVPLKVVEQELVEAAREDDELHHISKGSYLAKHYAGPSVAIGKERFATDMKEVDRLIEAETAELKAAPKAEGSKPAAPAPKPAPSTYQIAERKRAKAAKAKAELRRAQFAAIAPNLPTSIGGSVNQAAAWSLFLVSHLVDELTNDTMRVACKALNLEPPKKGQYGGYNFAGALKKHAEKLSPPDRVRFALQLLVAGDLNVSPYGSASPKRLEEAAKLAGVNLKKVKVDSDREFPAGASAKVESAAVKKAAKPGKAKKRTPNAAFMKPYVLTPALEAVVGKGPMTRTELTTRIWKYIKKNGLQDQKERRMVNADEKLKLIFKGKKQVSMFEMTKLLNKQIPGYNPGR